MVVHLHTVKLDVSPAKVTACRHVLSEAETHRAERFTRPKPRLYWLVARAALREILSIYTATTPNEIEFGEGKFGKPTLAGDCADNHLHFNLSHSRNRAMIAVTRVAPVGIDIEYERVISDWERVARRFFSADENRQLSEVVEADRQHAFYSCWTRKEAVIKATGQGLSARLDSFDVSLKPGQPATILNLRGEFRGKGDWFLQHIAMTDRFVGAIAVRHSGPIDVKYHDLWNSQSA